VWPDQNAIATDFSDHLSDPFESFPEGFDFPFDKYRLGSESVVENEPRYLSQGDATRSSPSRTTFSEIVSLKLNSHAIQRLPEDDASTSSNSTTGKTPDTSDSSSAVTPYTSGRATSVNSSAQSPEYLAESSSPSVAQLTIYPQSAVQVQIDLSTPTNGNSKKGKKNKQKRSSELSSRYNVLDSDPVSAFMSPSTCTRLIC
jgi:hypothetical protein